ncbi:hypothetical protein TRFO_22245 [Tritrichomonas foetus]|uniref:RING-type domain-containing protein n=1 Tax=Tritrichomonas foetus TaxID=1144522 RepID=A0A1J4KGS6_9EUKA|nr:hypothetical protein TRFO_22245 [Tritrichomonas foetus]|eukprot:OHT09004.1 hypothetical protein TRFO_22245 [Tritrichomonas foetus]
MSSAQANDSQQTRSWTTYQFFNTQLDAYESSNAFQNWDCCDSGHGLIVFGSNSPEGPMLTIFDGQKSESESDLPSTTIKEPNWRVEQVRAASYAGLVLAFFTTPTGYVFTIYSTTDNFAQQGQITLKKETVTASLVPTNQPNVPFVNPVSISPKLKRFAVLLNPNVIRIYEQPYSKKSKIVDIDFEEPITNHFQVSNFQLQRVLFVTTENGVYFTIRQANGGYQEKFKLSNDGVKPDFASTTTDGRLVCLRDTKVTLYTDSGQTSSFEIEEEVRMIKWMKNSYLIGILAAEKTANVRIYNPETHAIFGRCSEGHRVRKLLIEWNSVILILDDNSVTKMTEADMHEKIQQLIKNEQFDVALVVASSQQMGQSVISEIHRQRGDSCQEKRQFQEAINEYKMTIGFLEPSYVITRFIDPQHAEYLVDYLEELYRKGKVTKEHTTLLFNCYTKLRKTHKLQDFISTCLKDAQEKRDPKFNLETAVQVLCLAGFNAEALAIAKAFHMHDYYTRMLSETSDYLKILGYIRDVETNVALKILKVYGNDMMMSFNPSNRIGFRNYLLEACLVGLRKRPDSEEKLKMNPDDIMRVFLNFPNELFQFLKEYVERNRTANTLDLVSKIVWTTIIELSVSMGYEEEATNYFQMANGNFDSEQLLLIFKAEKCRYGLMLLYEHLKYYQEIIRLATYDEITMFCEKFGEFDENIYRLGLVKLALRKDRNNLAKLVQLIADKNALPLLAVQQILRKYNFVTFGILKPLAKRTFADRQKHILELQAKYNEIEADVSNEEDQTNALTYDHFIAKQTRCSGCHQAIDLPAKHFLCGHSFHLRCLGDDLTKCAVCKEMQEKIVLTKVESFKTSSKYLEMNSSGSNNLYQILDLIDPENNYEETPVVVDQFSNLSALLQWDLMNPDDDGEKLQKATELHKQYTTH